MYHAYTENKELAETSSAITSNPTLSQKIKFKAAYTAADLTYLQEAIELCSMPQLALELHKLYPSKEFSDILGAVNQTHTKLMTAKADEMSLQDVLNHCKWPAPTTTAPSSSSAKSSPSPHPYANAK